MTGDTVNNSAEDRAAFRAAMRDMGVKPRDGRGRDLPAPPSPSNPPPMIKPRAAPRPGRPRADRGVLVDTTGGGEGEFVSFARGGVQKAVMRRLKRGDPRPGARLDLHGHTATEACDAIDRFLARAGGRGVSCALIIHGKGLRSGSAGGVLKGVTCAHLKRHPTVQAFCSAQPKDGGGGAVYILLKSARGRRR